MYRKILTSIAATGVLLSLVWGCHKSSTDPAPSLQPQVAFSQSECKPGSESGAGTKVAPPGPFLAAFGQSQCLTGTEGSPGDADNPGGTVRFVVENGTLSVYHDTAYYNCCSQFVFDLEEGESTLDFIEVDTASSLCYCMCYVNLQITAVGLSPGTYTARLWTEGKEILLGESEVTITGGVWFETLCDTLVVHHDNWFTNCCAEIMFDFQQDGSLLVFTEIDTAASWCYCQCYFDLKAQVSGLANGTYQVQVWNVGHVEGWDDMPDTLVGEGEVEISCFPMQSPLARAPGLGK